MNDFKKNNRFGGGDRRGGFGKKPFGRPSFGGGRGFGAGRSMEMFQAVCASCGKTCEVPFRPNGKKPVYCKECFAENGGPAAEPRNERPFAREGFPSAPRNDSGKEIIELKKQVEALGRKIDALMTIVSGKTEPVEAKPEPVAEPFPVAANMPAEKEPKAKKTAAKKKK